MLMVRAIENFYTRCIAINVSTRTIDTYRYTLKRFMEMTGKTDLSEIDSGVLFQFFADMRQKGYAPDTISGQYRALRTFFKYLYDNGHIPRNPMDGIKKPKMPKVFARTFTIQEITKIMDVFANKSDEIGLRNYAIISVLFGTGIRKGELLGLTILDVNMAESILTVTGKGNKQRIIPITGVLKRTLKRYMGVRRGDNCPFLFVTRDGDRMTEGCLMEIFKTVKNETGIKGSRVSPHTMRHTFAKMFLLNGGDLFALQKVLGHEDISTTRMYVDYTEKEMSVQMQQCSPLENHRWTYF